MIETEWPYGVRAGFLDDVENGVHLEIALARRRRADAERLVSHAHKFLHRRAQAHAHHEQMHDQTHALCANICTEHKRMHTMNKCMTKRMHAAHTYAPSTSACTP